jgi:hypothetical protein
MHVQLEVPRFGEFARQHTTLSASELAQCLARQREHGGRVGQLLVDAGYLTPNQVIETLRAQAGWAARMRSNDSPQRFPIATPVSLCFPCYNEEEVIHDVLSGACAVLPEFLDEFELVIVDDGSKDATAAIVEEFARQDEHVRLVRHERNRGYGAAVATALRAAQGEWICFTDGDGQFNPLDLPQLLVDAQRTDIVVGYRYNRADNGMRRLNALGWKWLIRCLMGVRVRDLDCAFKIFPRRIIDKLDLSSEGACINAEILAQCFRGGASITEVPVNHYPRSAGKATGANLKVVAKAFRELPVVWRHRHMEPWKFETTASHTNAAGAHAANGASTNGRTNRADSMARNGTDLTSAGAAKPQPAHAANGHARNGSQ